MTQVVKPCRFLIAQSKKISLSFALLCFVSILLNIVKFKSPFSETDYLNSNFKVLGLSIPQNLEFAGERVPQNDYEIKESLEKEFFKNKAWKNSSLLLFRRAQKWFPLIEPILKKEGVPDDFKYVAIIESHLSNVISPMGATGFWQLMPITAQHYGLKITNEVDERLDVEKSTIVACKHFKDAHHYFKNWTLSAAAYNIGIGGIQSALKKQNTNNYYELLLNKETGSFIYRILAYKTLLSNPQHFGVKHKLKQLAKFPAYKIIKVDSSICNIDAFASYLSINTITLKTLNPWLKADKLTNPDNITYEFKIPKNKDLNVSAYIDDVFPKNITLDNTSTQPIITDSTKIAIDTLNINHSK